MGSEPDLPKPAVSDWWQSLVHSCSLTIACELWQKLLPASPDKDLLHGEGIMDCMHVVSAEVECSTDKHTACMA